MNTFRLMLLNLTCVMVAHGQATERPVDSKITAATVFLNRAQITREAKARLEPGRQAIVLSGLSGQLDPASINVRGTGAFTLLNISHRQNFLDELSLPPYLRTLKDSISYYNRLAQQEQAQRDVLTKEEQLLLANQKIGGQQNITVAELKALADFYKTRLTDIALSRMRADERIKMLQAREAKLQKQLQEQTTSRNRNTSEIVVQVSAEAATSANLSVSYVVSSAGWYPQYDVRATNIKSPVQVQYKAQVFQSTGEDWNNVKLTLSTANPNLGGLKPELFAWRLDFYEPIAYKSYREDGRGAMKRALNAPQSVADEEEIAAAPAETVAEYVNTIQTTLNTEFAIALPYTVASATKPVVVDIRSDELKSNYHYAVAPKLDADAFLIAKTTGWEELSLLPGEANIFFEGTYVGKTFIDPNQLRDTLAISLGRDKRIVVKREKIKDLTSRKTIGTSQRETAAWQISVRNTKSEPVRILVEDQLPISGNTQIEVSVLDVGGAQRDAATGKLTWALTLAPSETKTLNFKYEVKYPKDKQVSGL